MKQVGVTGDSYYSDAWTRNDHPSRTGEIVLDALLTLGHVAAGGTVAGSGELFGYPSTYGGLLAGLRLEPRDRMQIALLAETGWSDP